MAKGAEFLIDNQDRINYFSLVKRPRRLTYHRYAPKIEKMRVLALALTLMVMNIVGISPAHAATFNCGSGGTYTVVDGVVTGSANCSGVLTIDSSVTAIDDYAFSSVRFTGSEFIMQNPSVTILTIPSSVLTIGSSAFAGMTSMTSISIANSVTTIGRNAFRQNNNVTELIIGSGASLIESDTYQQYEHISKVVVPEGVTRIDPGAFTELYSTTSFTLPSTLTNLGSSSLRNMRSLRSINIPTGLSTANDYFGYLTNPSSVPYFCSTTGSSATSAVNEYFATLIDVNTDAGRCSNTFGAPTITSVTFPNTTSAAVNFTPPNNFGAGTAIASYSVVAFPGGKRATVSGAAARSVTLSSLNPGTEYTFEVNAINDEGSAITSPPSARSASVTCCAVSTTVPGAPTIGAVTALSPTSASVAFTAPTSNGGATIQSYTATSTPGSITGQVFQSGSGSITVTGLTSSTAYTFTVTASNSAGTSSASSASTSITMPASDEELAAQAAQAAAARDAAARAASEAAAAKREVEKKAARAEILSKFKSSEKLSLETFKQGEISGITEENIEAVSAEILALPEGSRSDITQVLKVAYKYEVVGAIASERVKSIYSNSLIEIGLIHEESKHKAALTAAIKKLPVDERSSYAEIKDAIDNEMAEIQGRKDRYTAILALIASRRNG